MLLASDFPRYSTFARYGDLAGVGDWTICRIRQSWESSAKFSFLEVEHCIFPEWDILSEEIVEVV